MLGRQCARCGRIDPAGDEEATIRSWHRNQADDLDEPLFGLLRRPWASINGEDVCPSCQTVPERKDVARRILAAIETEINRSVALDIEPSPVEPGLVTFAMQLREALLSDEKVSASLPGPAPADDLTRQRRPTELEVAITGAFLTGCALDVSVHDYDDVQRRLVDILTQNAGQGWTTDAEVLREGTYITGGGFSTALPLVIACRGGDEALVRTKAILKDRPTEEHDWLDRRMSDWTVKPTSMRIDVYDLGVAVINGTFAVAVPAHLNLTAAAGMLEEMVWLRPDSKNNAISAITGTFRELSKETTEQFCKGIKAMVPAPKRQSSWLSKREKALEETRDWGRLLWLHPVHLLTSEDRATRKTSAKDLAPTFSNTIEVPDGRFVTGIGRSAIVTTPNRSARDVPMKLVLLHWAYFALYMEIDRGLMDLLDRDKKVEPGTLRKLEDAAESVFDYYIRVMKARARVDSTLAGLGGDEQAIWDAIAKVQKFDALVGGVDRKVETLQRIADRRVQQATSVHARRNAKILGFLTTLTLVTLAIALLGYFFGGLADRDDTYRHLRYAFLAGGLLCAGILWYWIFGEHAWRMRGRNAPGDDHRVEKP